MLHCAKSIQILEDGHGLGDRQNQIVQKNSEHRKRQTRETAVPSLSPPATEQAARFYLDGLTFGFGILALTRSLALQNDTEDFNEVTGRLQSAPGPRSGR